MSYWGGKCKRPCVRKTTLVLKYSMDALPDAVADSNSFDVSGGTSVAVLQGFLNATAVVSIDQELKYCVNTAPTAPLKLHWILLSQTSGKLPRSSSLALQTKTSNAPFAFSRPSSRFRFTSGPTRLFSARYLALRRVSLIALVQSLLTRLTSVEPRFLSVSTPLTSSCCSSPFKSLCPFPILFTKARATAG